MPLLLSWLLACSGVSPQPEDVELAASIGTGDWEWQDLEDGDGIPVIMGPQGGYHLLGSVRVSGVAAGDSRDLSDPGNPTTTFSVWHSGENLTERAVFVEGLDPILDDTIGYRHEMLGRFAILSIGHDSELDGEEIRFHVRVEDVDGRVVEDERFLLAYPYPYNE